MGEDEQEQEGKGRFVGQSRQPSVYKRTKVHSIETLGRCSCCCDPWSVGGVSVSHSGGGPLSSTVSSSAFFRCAQRKEIERAS